MAHSVLIGARIPPCVGPFKIGNAVASTIKDSPELNSPNRSGASSQGTESKSSQSRSNPVCLEVGVTIRSLPGEAGGPTQPIREEGRTVIVFDNGAVLRSASNLSAGQKVILSNHNGRDVVCRVGSARNLPSVKGYVEVEFLEPASDFWGIHQSPAPVVPATPLASPPARRETSPPPPPANPVTSRATSPVETPSKPSNVFLGKGPTFEDIPGLVSTSTTVVTRDSKAQPRPAPEKAAKESPSYSYSDVADPNSLANWDAPSAGLPAEVDKISLADEALRHTSASHGRTPTHDFLSSGLMAYEKPRSEPGESAGRTPLILGLAALVLAGVGAVVFVMHRNAAPGPVANANAVNQPGQATKPAPPAASPAPSPAEQLPLDAAVQSAGEAAAQGKTSAQPVVAEESHSAPVIAPVPAVVTNSVRADEPTESRTDSRNARQQEKSAAAAKQPDVSAARRPAIPNLKIASPSAPNQNLAASSDNAAPTEIASSETVGATSAGLLTSAGRTSAPPAPPSVVPPPSSPTPAVNTSREAKLLSSTRPVYPAAAKESNIQGSVTISANVDATGRVTGARALTGPFLLREAAINSVKQWKYSPALVNGNPAASLVVVSVEFKLN